MKQPDKIERELPSNLDAEREFLGALMLQNEIFAQVAGFLTEADFFDEVHQRIYSIAAALISENKIASPITLRTFTGEHDLGAGWTMGKYLARLVADSCPPVVALDYAKMIHDLYTRRMIIKAAEDASAQAFDSPVEMKPAEIAMNLLETLSDLTEDPSSATRSAAGDSAYRLIERAQSIRQGDAPPLGTPTGLVDLDNLTGGGYHGGQLWIFAGRPGMGKSVMASSSGLKVAERKDDRGEMTNGVLLFSFELNEDQCVARMLSDLAYMQGQQAIPFSSILRGSDLDDAELYRVNEAQRRLARMPITVDYASRLKVIDIRTRIHSHKRRLEKQGKTLRVVFIDYLKFIQSTDRYKGNRVHEVGETTQGLRQIAKDENVCIVLVCQLSRGVEGREDKRPTLADLRDSGEIEQDADVVAFIYREAYYFEHSKAWRDKEEGATERMSILRNQAEFIIDKNRLGPTRTVKLWCDVSCARVDAGHF